MLIFPGHNHDMSTPSSNFLGNYLKYLDHFILLKQVPLASTEKNGYYELHLFCERNAKYVNSVRCHHHTILYSNDISKYLNVT